MVTVILLLIMLNVGAVQAAQPAKPDDVVKQLYTQIVKRHPLGIPTGADKNAIWPFLSKRLIKILETGQACEDDYFRKNPDTTGEYSEYKPEFGWLEDGLFSGGNELAMPTKVVVERTEQQKDGTYSIYIQFAYKDYGDQEYVFHWNGVVNVTYEEGRFVVDDILLLFKEDSTTREFRLSKVFQECDGPQWIGPNIVREPRTIVPDENKPIESGVYGIKGTGSLDNKPGARSGSVSWTDSTGNLWLFGGSKINFGGDVGDLNDLWKFEPSTGKWIWVSGDNIVDKSALNFNEM
jgi:hypothetical protein